MTGPDYDSINDKVLQTAQNALTHAPDAWLPNMAMAYYLSSNDVQRFEAANRFYEKARLGNPNNGELLQAQGNALLISGHGHAAVRAFEESYRRDPRSFNSVIGAAQGAAVNGDRERARALIAEFVAFDPNSTYLQLWAGLLHHWLNDWDSALDALARAVALDPNNVGAKSMLGMLFTVLGDANTAEHWLSKQLRWTRTMKIPLCSVRTCSRPPGVSTTASPTASRDMRAKLIRGYSLGVRAKLAWEAEEYQAAGQYHREQRDYLLAFVRESNETGKIQMQFWSSWAILVAAQSSAVLGDREQSRALFQAVVEYYDRQPPVVNLFPDLQLGIAHAGLGNKAAAIEYFDAAQRNGARFFLLDHMDVTTGRYDIWGMHRDIAFQEIVARERRENAELSKGARQRHPDLFPPGS